MIMIIILHKFTHLCTNIIFFLFPKTNFSWQNDDILYLIFESSYLYTHSSTHSIFFIYTLFLVVSRNNSFCFYTNLTNLIWRTRISFSTLSLQGYNTINIPCTYLSTNKKEKREWKQASNQIGQITHHNISWSTKFY